MNRLKKIIKFLNKLFFYLLAIAMLFFAGLLGKEWLIPFYLGCYNIQVPWESMYKDNGNTLPNPVYDK